MVIHPVNDEEKGIMSRIKQGLILSTRIIPSYQIATLLEHHGWQIQVEHNLEKAWAFLKNRRIDILVVDVDDPTLCGADILLRSKSHQPISYAIALKRGYPGKSMHLAHKLDVDGYFYVNDSGYMLDTTRGLAPFFLTGANADHPETDRQLSKISGLTSLNHLPLRQTWIVKNVIKPS
jgi:hypothetical protein